MSLITWSRKKHNGKVRKCVWSTPLMSDTVCRELVEKKNSNRYWRLHSGVVYRPKTAFDTFDHKLHMKKLEKYSIRENTHSWLTSYLDDRFQYVQINNEKSELLRVTYGATQGSVLGPKLIIKWKWQYGNESLYENTFWGVITDHKLYWKPHLNNVKPKKNIESYIHWLYFVMLPHSSIHDLLCGGME